MTAPATSSSATLPEPASGFPDPQTTAISARSAPAPATPRLVKPLLTGKLWIGLILLTALGAFLRFWRLDYQAYWTDEGYTIMRTRDSYAYLLNNLLDQGFPPGWYMLIRWWRLIVQQFVPAGDAFGPQYLRMLPAFFGTLTVPAMYFLARQFTDRKGALLVMLLAAVNPFFIYYSRDIKMYAALYFFATLNMALFFHWQTTRRHLLWFPLYLLSGVALVTTDPVACAIPALQFIFLLTRPRPRPWDVPLWVLGAGVMSAIPYYWYFVFLRQAQWDGRISRGVERGMSWISDYTDMSWRTIASLPTSHIFGYLWPVYPPDARINNWFVLGGNDFNRHLSARSWPWMAKGELYAAVALFAIMLLGLIPWRGFRRNPERDHSSTRGRWWWVLLWIVLPSAALALTWLTTGTVWFERVWGWKSTPPAPMWEPRYLGIIVPAWLLWLGASLRRMPTIWVRAPLIAGVAGVCFYSSLSNHLIYRNTPYHRNAEVVEQYIDNKDRFATAVAVPAVAYARPAENTATTIARRVVPGSYQDQQYQPESLYSSNRWLWPNLTTPEEIAAWVRSAVVNNARVKTLVLTERNGDLPEDKNPISNQAMAQLLGPRWELVHEERYEWHYEWRFYIFHTWRTRVWKLKG